MAMMKDQGRVQLITIKEDGGHQITPTFLSEECYKEAVGGFILVTADIIIINREKKSILLGKRTQNPVKGEWWFMGGRRQAGAWQMEAVAKNFRKETGLEMPRDRFQFLTQVEWFFARREQEPQDAGSHNLLFLYTIDLADEEIATIKLEGAGFDHEAGLQVFDRDRVNAECRPEIRWLYGLIFFGLLPQEAWYI